MIESEQPIYMSVTEYAKSVTKSRQAILNKINKNKLPSNVSAKKIGSTWVITIKEVVTT